MKEYVVYYTIYNNLKVFYTKANSEEEAKNNLNNLISGAKTHNCVSIYDIENGVLTNGESNNG